VVPSLWIINIDEANRKNKFVQVAEHQEGRIKDYVLSLEMININSGSGSNKSGGGGSNGAMVGTVEARMAKASISSNQPQATSSSSSTLYSLLNSNASTFAQQNISTFKPMLRSLLLNLTENAVAMALSAPLPPNLRMNNSLSSSHLTGGATAAMLKGSPPLSFGSASTKINGAARSLEASGPKSSKLLASGMECCDVQVSYMFQEDLCGRLFVQGLLLILVVSRWLITRADLTLNQRTLILILSIATVADILNFFSYLNLELVYRNKYLLYSALLIITFSLVQFVFLHVEETLNLSGPPTPTFSMQTNIGAVGGAGSGGTSSGSNSTNNITSDDDLDAIVNNKSTRDHAAAAAAAAAAASQMHKKFPLIYKHYQFLKKHLKAESGVGARMNDYGHNKAIPIPFSQLLLKASSRGMMSKNLNSGEGSARRSRLAHFCYVVFCCAEPKDPLFFILLAGLFLHDGSYLSFRIFILSKIGWESAFSQESTLVFFMIKNIFIIVTQIYRVYTITNERRQRKFFDNYRDLIFATQQETLNNNMTAANMQGAAGAASASALHNAPSHLISPTSSTQNLNLNQTTLAPNSFYPTHSYMPNTTNAAVIAAAATNGQVPLVPLGSFAPQAQPSYFYPSATSNPYRFAQIYADAGSPTKNMYNRSMSTLASANGAGSMYYEGGNSAAAAAAAQIYNAATLPSHPGATTTSGANSTLGRNDSVAYYHASGNNSGPAQANSSYQSPSPYQQFNSPLADSLLAIMSKEYNAQNASYKQQLNFQYQQQQYDQNITLCQSPTTGSPATLTTPSNPFTAKVGKALYGLPFLSRSRTSIGLGTPSSAQGNNGASENNGLMASTFRNNGRLNQNSSNKFLKASKI
jgi:hypothetical protein